MSFRRGKKKIKTTALRLYGDGREAYSIYKKKNVLWQDMLSLWDAGHFSSNFVSLFCFQEILIYLPTESHYFRGLQFRAFT